MNSSQNKINKKSLIIKKGALIYVRQFLYQQMLTNLKYLTLFSKKTIIQKKQLNDKKQRYLNIRNKYKRKLNSNRGSNVIRLKKSNQPTLNLKKKQNDTRMKSRFQKDLLTEIKSFKMTSLQLKKLILKKLNNKTFQYLKKLKKKRKLPKKIQFNAIKAQYSSQIAINIVLMKLIYLSHILPTGLKDLEYLRFLRRYWSFFILYVHYVKTRKMPSTVLFFNKYNIPNVILEANRLDLPLISVADSNSLIQKMAYPITSNDDSMLINTFYSLLVIKTMLLTELTKLKKLYHIL